MFPAGTAGLALVLLRLLVVAMLLVAETAQWAPVISAGMIIGLALLSVFLCLGLMTPYCSTLCLLMETFALVVTRGQHSAHLVFAIVNNFILILLGPGAYSLDARIFGRKLLTLEPRAKPDSL